MFLCYGSSNTLDCLRIVRSALVVLISWLGWLRSSEVFSLEEFDVKLILPTDGPSVGLPRGLGALGLLLLPSTKGNQRSQADVWIAFTTISGLSIGTWWQRYLSLTGDPVFKRLIFSHNDGSPWTSTFFRQTFLFPWLHTQRQEGDPYLNQFDDSPGRSIPENFYSMGCFRRGARLDVSERRPGSVRRATKEERFEHARWRQKRAPDIDLHYLEWGIEERIKLTLLAM